MKTPESHEQQLDAWLSLTRPQAAGREIVRLPVLSGSMLPVMPLGAILEIEPATAAHCRIGDVVVFQTGPQRLTAHRVLTRWQIGSWVLFLQKGDNNDWGHLIRGAGVRGRVKRVIPADGDESAAVDPYNPEKAHRSRHWHYRNLIFHWPRRIRKFLRF